MNKLKKNCEVIRAIIDSHPTGIPKLTINNYAESFNLTLDEVDLVIDKILPSDVYTLEIWVDNQYCFPSDSKTKIQVEESAIGMGFINVETHDLWKELSEYAIQHGYLKQTEVKGDSSDFVVSDKAPEDTNKIWIDTNGGQE